MKNADCREINILTNKEAEEGAEILQKVIEQEPSSSAESAAPFGGSSEQAP